MTRFNRPIRFGAMIVALATCGGASAQVATRTPRDLALTRAPSAPSARFNAAYQRVEDHWERVLFLCDGVDGHRIKLLTVPDKRALSMLWSYAKPGLRTRSERVRIGDEDPGAGQIMREIRRTDGSVSGSVHSINPGILGNESTTTLPTLSSITDGAETTRCRWMARARVMLVDARRSVVVTADPGGGYTYRSYDYARPGKVVERDGGATSVATVTATGGRLVASGPKRETYEFRRGPWTYRVAASADDRAPGAALTVLRGGTVVQSSVAVAYQMAARRID